MMGEVKRKKESKSGDEGLQGLQGEGRGKRIKEERLTEEGVNDCKCGQ